MLVGTPLGAALVEERLPAAQEEPFQVDQWVSPAVFDRLEKDVSAFKMPKKLDLPEDEWLRELALAEPEPEEGETTFEQYANAVLSHPHDWLIASWVPPVWEERARPKRLELGGNFRQNNKTSWTSLLKSRWENEADWFKNELVLSGRYNRVENTLGANEWIITERFDWKNRSSPWLLFSKFIGEYDEIERLSLRSNLSICPGYRWLDEPKVITLVTRVGPAVNYKNYFGPGKETWAPELVADLEFRIGFGRATFEHTSTTNVNLQNAHEVRFTQETDFLIPLDRAKHWNWKTGFRQTFNTRPVGTVPRNEYEVNFSLVFQR